MQCKREFMLQAGASIESSFARRNAEDLKVAELKYVLESLGKSVKGKKSDLIAR